MDVQPITPSFVDIYADERACILRVSRALYDLVALELAPRTGVFPLHFWTSLALMVRDLGPINAQLLAERDHLQHRIDRWFTEHVGESQRGSQPFKQEDYVALLHEIGYLEPSTDDSFSITTNHVDSEIARIAAPQLVVPLDNPRFVVNAANARWYSLYDALYASNLVSGSPTTQGATPAGYDMTRGLQVIEWADRFLDAHVPLQDSTSFSRAVHFRIEEQQHAGRSRLLLVIQTDDGKQVQLADPHQWVGYSLYDDDGADNDTDHGDSGSSVQLPTPTTELKALVFRHHDLHIELQFYRASELAAGSNMAPNGSKARIRDVVLEAAVSTIADMEDSVAAVDASDKARIYRNWLGLMNGSLSATFTAASGRSVTRTMAPDRVYRSPDSDDRVRLHGRSLLLVRNVGLHMYTDAVQILRLSKTSGASTGIWDPVPEGFVDAMFSALAALHDIRVPSHRGGIRNSRTGSVYIVKPKLHGPKEVAFTSKLFSRIEDALELQRNTLKIGIMDEERRTTVNLPQCIRAAADRVVFINTGFLDRTGDEIRTHFYAGPMVPKNDIKSTTWIKAYEDWNVDVGRQLGLSGRAQIGKGMWAMPDEMRAMYDTKVAHPRSGANCAWVPSPMAAAIHAVHYHQVDVWAVQRSLGMRRALLADILVPPLMSTAQLAALTPQQRQHEIENNVQGILGYVVRWVGQGIGCSKVPNIDNVNLMEDRATLRISSQHIANWLQHSVVSRDQVTQALHKMARIVDSQNARDTNYRPMAPDFDRSLEFQAACRLIFDAATQPNGYTEWILHEARRQCKAQQQQQQQQQPERATSRL